MKLIAIDPGPNTSGVVQLETSADKSDPPGQHNTKVVSAHHKDPNRFVAPLIEGSGLPNQYFQLVIEWPVLYQTTGDDIRNTLAWASVFSYLGKLNVLCGGIYVIPRVRARTLIGAKPSGSIIGPILQLFDFGSKKDACGTRARPGCLYGVSGHSWDALAVGCAHLMGAHADKNFWEI